MLPHIKIGQTVKVRGYKGAIVIDVDEPFFDYVQTITILLIPVNGDLVPFWLKEKNVLGQSNQIEVLFEDITSREAAHDLNSNPVYALSRELNLDQIKIPEKKHPWTGFWIQDQNETPIGYIDRVEQFPQQEMAVVQVGDDTKLIPLADEYVIWIDKPNELIQLNIPEGLLDL